MNGPGLLWMLQTAAGLSMAGPMFIIGFDLLRSGQTLVGVGFFALGAVALYLPTYLIQRIGGPRAWIRRRLGRSRRGSGDEDGAVDTDTDSNSTPNTDLEAESPSSTDSSYGRLLERFRRR